MHIKSILTTSFFTTSLSLLKSAGTGTNLSTSNLSTLRVFYFIINCIFGFSFELLKVFLVFSLKVTYELLSIILACFL